MGEDDPGLVRIRAAGELDVHLVGHDVQIRLGQQDGLAIGHVQGIHVEFARGDAPPALVLRPEAAQRSGERVIDGDRSVRLGEVVQRGDLVRRVDRVLDRGQVGVVQLDPAGRGGEVAQVLQEKEPTRPWICLNCPASDVIR